MKSTYNQQIQYLTLVYKTKMKNNELEHEQEIREYKKQQKEQFEAFVTESKKKEEKILHEIVLHNMELKTN
jgi:hypothetical protein